jgi:hypothetical protein
MSSKWWGAGEPANAQNRGFFDRINKIYRILLVGRKAAKEFNPA